MGLFKKKIVKKTYDREHMKPVIRASICTGDVQNTQASGDDHNDHQRPNQRRDDPQIEVIQGIDVGNDAVK